MCDLNLQTRIADCGLRKGIEMNKNQIQEVLDDLIVCQKHVGFYVGALIDIARATIMELGAQVDALEIDNATLSHGNAQLMSECIKLKRQNEKYRSVLTSELNAVYEVRESRWRDRQLDPVVAIKCNKHEAVAICQKLNATGKSNYCYITRSEER